MYNLINMITRVLSLGWRCSSWIFRPWVVIYTWPNYEDNSYALSKGCAQQGIRVYIITARPFSKAPTYWQMNGTRVKSIWKFNPASLIFLYFANATFSSHGGQITCLTEISRRINIWHGVPLKSVGVKRGDKPPTASGFALSTSPRATELMRSMYDEKTPKFLEIGLPRNDLINKQSELNAKIGRLVYLPTYRISKSGMLHFDGKQFENGLCISNKELQELDKFLNSKNIYLDIIVHPMGQVELPGNLQNIMIKDRGNFESSLYSEIGKYDALISDYSSVIIDYLLSGKPIIVFSPDKIEYQDTRGLNLELSEIPGTYFAEELSTLVKSINEVYEGEAKQVLKESWHTFNDSNSTSRLLDSIFHLNESTIPKNLRSVSQGKNLLQASLYSALLGLLFPIAVLLTQPHRAFAEFWLMFSITMLTQSVFRTYCENVYAFNQNELKFKVSLTKTGLGIALIFAFLSFFALATVQGIATWMSLLAFTIINLSQYQTELIRSACIAESALREANLIAQISLRFHLSVVFIFLTISSFFSLDAEPIILFYSVALFFQALISKKVQSNMSTTGEMAIQNFKPNARETSNWFKSLYGLLPITLANIIVNYLLVFHNLESSLTFVRGTQILLTPIVYLSNLQIWTFENRTGLNELFNRRLLLLSLILSLPLIAFSILVSNQNVSIVTLLCGLMIFGEVLINLRSNFYQLSIRAKGKLFTFGTSRTILAFIQVTVIFSLIFINGLSPQTFSASLLLISLLNFTILKKISSES